MKAVSKFFAGAAGLAVAAGAFAAPAAAQYYPPYGGGYGSGNVIVGAILDSILRGGPSRGYGYGYGNQYGYQNERYAIDQCAGAAEARLNGYNRGYSNYGYGGAVRVNQIERVEVTRNGNMRVYGWAGQQGWRGNYGGYGGYNAPYGGYGGYNAPYGGYGNAAAPQIRFSCKVDRRTGRITDLDLNRARYGYRY